MAKSEKTNNGANLGFEDKLWAAADKLRGTPEYKHVVIGSLFNEPMRLETVRIGGLSACNAQAGTDPDT